MNALPKIDYEKMFSVLHQLGFNPTLVGRHTGVPSTTIDNYYKRVPVAPSYDSIRAIYNFCVKRLTEEEIALFIVDDKKK